MKKIIACIVLVTILMIGSCFVGAININTERETSTCVTSSFDENDADLPIWNVGDSWTYNVELELEQNQYFELDVSLEFENLEFEVIEVQNSNDMYKLKITVPTGGLTGSGSVDLDIFTLTGNILNAQLDGFIYVKKSTLEINKFEVTIMGDTNKILLPHFNVYLQLEFEEEFAGVKENFSSLKFPMNIDETWAVPDTYLNISTNAHQPNLGSGRLYSYVPEHDNKCIKWDLINVGNADYDALKISCDEYGDRSDIWYSPAVGNTVKIDYKNVELGFGYLLKTFTMNLKSTTYQADSDPPETPSTPIGPTDFAAGETGAYQVSTTDPDGNKIKYIFDWGDGTSKTYTGFVDSGETVEESHLWGKDGSHNLKVKARDKYGQESDWSDPLVVNVVNNAPLKPETPDGPTQGSYKQTHSYSTKTTDPDGHKIKYGWDWNGDDRVDEWTGLYNSDEIVTTPHKWSSEGVYNIKVKAQDEYGEESDWSETLSVSMPKFKTTNFSLKQLIQQLNELFPFLEQLLVLLKG